MNSQLNPAEKKIRNDKIKQVLCAVGAAVVILCGFYLVFHFTRAAEVKKFAEHISDFGPRKGVPRTIEDLEKAISSYEKLQEQHVKDAAQTATYWKILGTRFQDKGMWLEAVNSFRHAIDYTPDDEVLHYLTAVNAAQYAKSAYDYDEGRGGIGENSRRYFNLAEDAYKRAIELEPNYSLARYGLSVLYIYELNRPDDAVPQLLQYMEGRSGDADAMFMLARALYSTGKYREAVEWYDRGIAATKDEAKKAQAQANKNFIMENYY